MMRLNLPLLMKLELFKKGQA